MQKESTGRVIKFRAWDSKTKKMYPIHRLSWGRKGLSASCFQRTYNTDPSADPSVPREYEYVPETMDIMQFTGLTDKNGKEIYEGDVVVFSGKIEKSAAYEIEYLDVQFKAVRPERKNQCGLAGTSQWIEVIGTVYENPELLTA